MTTTKTEAKMLAAKKIREMIAADVVGFCYLKGATGWRGSDKGLRELARLAGITVAG